MTTAELTDEQREARRTRTRDLIEARLTERLGDAGRKIHTGRSRNDQVLVATRLWLKDRLACVAASCRESAEVALARAETARAASTVATPPPASAVVAPPRASDPAVPSVAPDGRRVALVKVTEDPEWEPGEDEDEL